MIHREVFMKDEFVENAFQKFQSLIPSKRHILFKKALRAANDNQYEQLMSCPVKSSKKTILFAVFLGVFAVDRFYWGDIVGGVCKIFLNIFTFGVFSLIDIPFSISGYKKKNYKKLMLILA